MSKQILYVYLAILLGGPPSLLGQINHQVTFPADYSLDSVILADGNTYTRLIMPDIQTTDSIGYPVLPVKYIKLIIPANSDVTNIIVTKTVKEKQVLNKPIAPVQPPIPTALYYEKPDFVKPDKEKYDSDSPYPGDLIKIIHQGYFRENRIVTLAVYPFQYYPKDNELVFHSLIDFTLEYSFHKPTESKTYNLRKYSEYGKILRSIIDNKKDIEKYDVYTLSKKKNISGENGEDKQTSLKSGTKGITVDCEYVIVTNEDLAPEFNEFIAWKRRKGVDIELITIEDIKANYSGDNISGINDDAGRLRQFLADAYNDGYGIEYALLAGNPSIVPIRYGYIENNTTDDYNIIPTDLYFSDFQGDWEVDGDTLYGEPQPYDDPDWSSEIYVGRLLVTNAEEVRNWTKKVLVYERNPGNGDYSYLTRAFFTQADHLQDYWATPDGQARYIAKKFYPVFNDTLIWEEMYNGVPDHNSPEIPDSPTGRNIISRINGYHYGLVSWFAHGATIGVAVGTKGNNGTGEEHCKWNVAAIDNYDELYGYQYAEETDNGFDNLTNKNFPMINYSLNS